MNPIRSSLIILQEPAFHRDKCPDGLCHWCGLPLRFKESATWHNRQRVRHKGDGLEVLADGSIIVQRNCDREFRQSMVWNGQNALRWQAWKQGPFEGDVLRYKFRLEFGRYLKRNEYAVYCVGCGDLCETGFVWVPKKRVGFATRRRTTHKKWEADHEIELADGGIHTLENLRSRCRECHVTKTTQSAIDRRILVTKS